MKYLQKIFFLCILFLLFLHPYSVDAASSVNKMSLPAITVINPIRGNELGHEKDEHK